ncbi:hypothetical protein F383_32590 [Gossypium arboreum]|uniref:Uncharacterized protein n=1 Tax=Gossypium arboreum TaxID=29729 RepID=A0A0B0PHJ7_GOSAR|nr:hypothetical protein F383_32590 [Gossypium arboreum]
MINLKVARPLFLWNIAKKYDDNLHFHHCTGDIWH